ncbi:hypothetical protein MRX96_027154 [Rhipicephalus microplus]
MRPIIIPVTTGPPSPPSTPAMPSQQGAECVAGRQGGPANGSRCTAMQRSLVQAKSRSLPNRQPIDPRSLFAALRREESQENGKSDGRKAQGQFGGREFHQLGHILFVARVPPPSQRRRRSFQISLPQQPGEIRRHPGLLQFHCQLRQRLHRKPHSTRTTGRSESEGRGEAKPVRRQLVFR